MPHNMPNPDSALKNFFRNNEIFAALFNGYFFQNESIVHADELEPEDTAYGSAIKINQGRKHKVRTEKINKYRDIIRRTSLGYLIILGIENQDKIHYSMPVRNNLYDVLGYSSELSTLSDTHNKSEWTIDEWLSNTKKGTKVTPIITVVFYTGEDPWDGPTSLHEMMEMDDRIKSFVPDYPLHIIDIGHDNTLSFNNRELRELKEILSAIYSDSADKNESLIDNSIISLAGILTGDENLYYSAIEAKGGKQKLCKVLEEKYNKIRAEKDAEFASERKRFGLLLTEKDEALAEKDEALAEKDEALAEKDAEIEALKKQLAAALQ